MNRPRGMILFIVVVVVAMISLAAYSFCLTMSTENKAAHLRGDQLQLEQTVASGVELIKGFVARPRQLRVDAGGWDDNPDVFRNQVAFDDRRTNRTGRFSVVSPKIDAGSVSGLRFGLEDESARLDLRMVLAWEQQSPGAGKQALMKLPNMTEALADAILDWMDPDDAPRPYGAEADFYATRGVPYGPRNGVPVSLEELLLIRGVTRQLLFGSDTDLTYGTTATTPPPGDQRFDQVTYGTTLSWSSLLTVLSAERNLTPEGYPRINLNDNNLRNLQQRLAAVLGAATADFIVAYRQFGPYTGPLAANPGSGVRVDLSQPARFAVMSVLDLVGANVQVQAAGGVALILASPLPANPQALRDLLPRLLDYTTTTARPATAGRLNINLAPRLLLQCIPGLDDALIDRILAARELTPGQDTTQHDYPTWLWSEGLVDLPTMRALLPSITAGGDVWRAQIVGYFDNGGPAYRAEAVVDATGLQPRQLYWKDLRSVGRGFPRETFSDANAPP